MIVALVHEEQFHLSGGYFTLFYSASAFLTTWLSYLEMFSLPRKKKYAVEKLHGEHDESNPPSRPTSSRQIEATNEDEDATESSSLLRSSRRSAYKTVNNDDSECTTGRIKERILAKHDEQEWSGSMWDWLWLLQFIILAPINVVILGQLGFYLVEALHQTGQDGSSVFIVYLGIAIITIFMFTPIVPLIHRYSWHLPTFLLLVLVGTLVYNLLAFPFSAQNRLKLYFQQQIDIDNGNNTVSLLGLSPYVEEAISDIPSAAGQKISCHRVENRKRCGWTGPVPSVAGDAGYTFSKSPYKGWINYNVSIVDSSKSTTTARFSVGGKNSRNCKLAFDIPVSNIHIAGQSPEDERLPSIPEGGSKELRLWSRTWNRTWTVDVAWNTKDHGKKMTGKVLCEWADVNQKGVIPAFDEASHYVPNWVAITKAADGLVEAYRRFDIS